MKKRYIVIAAGFFIQSVIAQVITNPYQAYFNQAYIENPSVPKGMLEAVAYTQSRFNPIQPTEYGSCMGMPQAYGLMGLIADGKDYFRNNLVLVSRLSGYSVADIMELPEAHIKAYAKAYAALLAQAPASARQKSFGRHTWVLSRLSELPLDANAVNNFALNTHLYGIYTFLNKPEFQRAYVFPQHPIDMEDIFGMENLSILSAGRVLIDEENQVIKDAQGNAYRTNSPASVQSADYGPALWNPAASCNYTVGRGGTAISAVVIHDVEGTYAGCISWFQNCSAVVSAHYVVRSSDGQITQMVLEADKAWHVGSENAYTIGIEHEGYEAQTGWYTTAMYTSSAALVRDICNSGYGINPLRTYNGPSCSGSSSSCQQGSCVKIKGHQMYPNQTHNDPGPNWDWYTYYTLVNNAPTTNTVATASGTLYDSGGPNGNYSNDERTLTLIQPAGATNITLSFTHFNLETNWDYLFIYDGNSVTSPLIGRYTGTNSPGTITSSGGALLLDFRSDCATVDSGWVANYTSNSSSASDHVPPTTQCNVNGTWQTQNFSASFTDADNAGGSGLEKSYYQVIDYDGTNWTGNYAHGFFADDFDAAILPQWTQKTGTWSINNQALYQGDTTLSNTNIYAPLTQTLSNRYLYYFTAKIGSIGTNRRAGFHFMCTQPDSSNRGDGYFVWFRVDQSQLQIYKVVNNNYGSPVYTSTVTVNANQSYNYIVIFDRISGLMRVYQNNALIGSWTDTSPYTSGSYISFRTGNASMEVDQIRVYRSRYPSVSVSVGPGNANDIRYQNQDPFTPAAHINSICSDSATNLSAFLSNIVNVDWTAPSVIDSVRDGLGADINITSSKTTLSANWNNSFDTESGIAKYMYCIGTTPGDSNTVAWTSNMDSVNVTQTGLNLTQGQWYYFTVKAVDGAGLECAKTSSNGQKVDTTSQSTGLQKMTNAGPVKIWPNPAQNNIRVSLHNGQTGEIKLYDVLGKEVRSETIQAKQNTADMDVSSLPDGVYIIHVKTGTDLITQKIVVQH